jgi:predicted hotdog family 3-hydroxylacyl-ACP dehydratase
MKIEDLVPHSGDMCLLDEVISFDKESLRASARIKNENPFLIDDFVSSWIGVEYMAQAIAAWAGTIAVQKGEAIRLGFLVGTREYNVDSSRFAIDTQLDIQVKRIMEGANGLSVFECHVDYGDGVAMANINVFQPDDVDLFLGDTNR